MEVSSSTAVKCLRAARAPVSELVGAGLAERRHGAVLRVRVDVLARLELAHLFEAFGVQLWCNALLGWSAIRDNSRDDVVA